MGAVALAAMIGAMAGSVLTALIMVLLISGKRGGTQERLDNEWGPK